MNWHIGKRIKEDILYNQRAEYGKEIVKNLSVLLTENYGKGWGYEKLKHCVRSAYTFTEEEIGYSVRTQLTWTIFSHTTSRQKTIILNRKIKVT